MTFQQQQPIDIHSIYEDQALLKDLLLSAVQSDQQKYRNPRMLTLDQMKKNYDPLFRKHGINIEDLPPSIWVELRRARLTGLSFELGGDLKARLSRIIRQVISEQEQFEHLVILAWIIQRKRPRRWRLKKTTSDLDSDFSENRLPV